MRAHCGPPYFFLGVAMAKNIKKGTFITGPDDSLSVEDAYDASALKEVNKDTNESKLSPTLLAAGIPANKVKASSVDSEFKNKMEREGKTVLEGLREVKDDLPGDAKLSDVMKSNSLSDVGVSLRRVTGSLPGGDVGQLEGADLDFLVSKTGDLTKKLGQGGDFELGDLVNGNGVDITVAAAVGLLNVKKLMDKNPKGLLGVIADTQIAEDLRDFVLDEVVELAAEYGLGGVAEALIDIIGERFESKRRPTVIQLISGFRFSQEPVVTEVEKPERDLIEAAAGFFGLDEGEANVVAEVVEIAVYDEEYPNKKQQAKAFVDSLYSIDSKWDKVYRKGSDVPASPHDDGMVNSLNLFDFASKDAREAFLLDERTQRNAVIQFDRKVTVEQWETVALRWYPYAYI